MYDGTWDPATETVSEYWQRRLREDREFFRRQRRHEQLVTAGMIVVALCIGLAYLWWRG